MTRPDLKKIPPNSIYEFRKISENEEIKIPETATNRRCTDIVFLIIFIVSVLILIVLVICSLMGGTNFGRFLNGYDKCGDICGSKNKPNPKINCSGKSLLEKPFMKYKFTGVSNGTKLIGKNYMIPDVCVENCKPPDKLFFRRCIPFTTLPYDRKATHIITHTEFVDDFRRSVVPLLIPMCVTGLVLSAGLMFGFHYFPRKTVYGILVASITFMFVFAGYIWYSYLNDINDTVLFSFGILSTIMIFFLILFICYFHDKYSLLVEMFIEATNVTFKVPYLNLLPLWTLLFLTVVLTTTVFLICLIGTNQTLREISHSPSVYQYVTTPLSKATITYLIFFNIFIISFANGSQCIIVAGPVSAYYFQRDKSSLPLYPVLTSFYILLRYHLGTVAFGSLCITMITVGRVILNFLQDHLKCKQGLKCLDYWLTCFEQFVQYLTKRAYIETAIHGKTLYKSGMRAARLLWVNLMDTVCLDVVADFIMVCTTLLMVLLSAGVAIIIRAIIGLELEYFWMILLLGTCSVGAIIYFFMQIINVAVETIFICFCEDKLLNDGKTRPYFMSQNLKSLVDRAKKVAKRRQEE